MITVRPAHQGDCDQLFALAKGFATTFVPEMTAFSGSFLDLIAAQDTFLLVAEDADEVCGYLLGFEHPTFFANGRVAWIEEIMVREDRRRRGIGQQMMCQFETWARSRNAKLVALGTRRAAAFYQAQGYQESAAYFRKIL